MAEEVALQGFFFLFLFLCLFFFLFFFFFFLLLLSHGWFSIAIVSGDLNYFLPQPFLLIYTPHPLPRYPKKPYIYYVRTRSGMGCCCVQGGGGRSCVHIRFT